ncbi:hypothetical protein A2415_04115 [candidate division WWE3 bacterium RIFOXYC1_FULL_39_7]|uniref:Uncharacterized protein n=2 Tax=Katanobacteria TaxID=422282 RepID=A0A1F4X7K8_UNCKA|nr:MAG: hypothetical protein A2415_04115 [candidate division WWE3 bacterium RIFOXYC1_FULL_39_7]OGC77638.1 MAG: hypothetical protein A2619_05365 [candidate division WWE3 bacterium RIFOXYD1_FULL_39_9]
MARFFLIQNKGIFAEKELFYDGFTAGPKDPLTGPDRQTRIVVTAGPVAGIYVADSVDYVYGTIMIESHPGAVPKTELCPTIYNLHKVADNVPVVITCSQRIKYGEVR